MDEWATLDALGAILAAKGPEQRSSRLDILRDALTPSYLRDTPSSPQADIALSDPSARPGKIGPPSGPPTTLDKLGGFAADAAGWLAPEVKTIGAMAVPLKGGDIFAQRIRDLIRKLPDTSPHEGKVAIGEVYDAYRDAYPRDYQSQKAFGYRLVNAGKTRNLDLARLDMPEYMDKELRLRSETPWGDDTVHFVVRPDDKK